VDSGVDFSTGHLFDQLSGKINEFLPKLPEAMVVLLFGVLVIRLISWIASWLIGFIRIPKALKGILISLFDALLAIFLIIVVLQTLGLNNVALVVSASIAALGLALGNGSVTMVADILAGFHLAQDKDFNLGDVVRAGDSNVEGEILSMDMRRTRIRDHEGYIHSIPNAVIERKEFVLVTKKADRAGK
jgi:small-conductance mechanosensitive channel